MAEATTERVVTLKLDRAEAETLRSHMRYETDNSELSAIYWALESALAD